MKGQSLGKRLKSKRSAEDCHDGEKSLVPELDMRLPSNELRVRASSPLLGYGYRAGQLPSASPQPKVTDIRKSGSWSDLQFFQDLEKPSIRSHPGHIIGPQKESVGSGTRLGGEELDKDPQQKPQRRGSKWRLRPTKLDLSLLFPKPRAPLAPLLSPQRLTHSPSPVASVTSDYSARKMERPPSTNKLTTKTPPRSRSTSQKRLEKSPKKDFTPLISRERRPVDWFDVPIEKAIRCADGSDIVQLDNLDSPHQASFPTFPSSDRLQSRSDKTLGRTSSNSYHTRGIDAQFGPKPKTPLSDTVRKSLDTCQAENGPNRRSVRRPVPKKRRKHVLANCDLTKCSVLSLSSSEDEDEHEDEEREAVKSDYAMKSVLRDSIATLDDLEPEICTAEAVLATKGSALTRLEKSDSFCRKSRQYPRSLSHARNSPTSSPVKRSQPEAAGQSRNSKGVSTISDPASSERRATPRRSMSASQFTHKRRLIAVTQQEESFLEAMRQRNGTITPSLFSEMREKTGELGPVPISPSLRLDLPHNSDRSFLRLSSLIPSPQNGSFPSGQSANSTREESDGFTVTASDVDPRGDNFNTSPRVSLIFSDSHSSASVGQVSPLTPTLPIHRFAAPSSSPPPFAPPSVPDNQKLHSRRRTDSSAALVPGNEEGAKEDDEFPIWAVQWTQDAAQIAMVH
ncbi:hypothetical protein V8E54_002747 [Elaphomyces granulatus]